MDDFFKKRNMDRVKEINLGSNCLNEVYPAKAYVRNGGRGEKNRIIWLPQKVTKVWLSSNDQAGENAAEGSEKNFYRLHFTVEGETGVDLDITGKQFATLWHSKYPKAAFDLVAKILRKSGEGLLIRDVVASRKMSFRTTPQIAEKIRLNSKRCKLSASAYIARCCDGVTPRQAFSDEQVEFLREFVKVRQDFQFFWNMMSVWRQSKTKEELADAVVMGENFSTFRRYIAQVLGRFDVAIGKLLNEKIQRK